MELLENINWETESELVEVNDLQEVEFYEEDFNVYFEYNGIKVFATVDFTLDINIYKEEETNTNDVEVISTDVIIKEMFDEDDNVFNLTARAEVRLQNKLATDLRIQF